MEAPSIRCRAGAAKSVNLPAGSIGHGRNSKQLHPSTGRSTRPASRDWRCAPAESGVRGLRGATGEERHVIVHGTFRGAGPWRRPTERIDHLLKSPAQRGAIVIVANRRDVVALSRLLLFGAVPRTSLDRRHRGRNAPSPRRRFRTWGRLAAWLVRPATGSKPGGGARLAFRSSTP